MPRIAAIPLLACLLWTAPASAQDVRAAADYRVELLSILFRLAGVYWEGPEHRCK